ncbi:MAG: hypothetical protein WD708_05365 [Kiritimatiellia bacterium]
MSLISGLHKVFLAGIALERMDSCRRSSVRLAKIELARIYLQGVSVARSSVGAVLRLCLLVGMMAMGLLLLHVALFMLLPWSLQTKAFLILGLGVTYTLTAGLVMGMVLRESSWIRKSGAQLLLDDALNPHHE